MTLLVLGRSGQLAQALAGPDTVCAGRETLDLADPADLDARLDALCDRVAPRAVVNAAAFTDVDGAEAEPPALAALNTLAPGAAARVAARRDLPFVHISTDYVFDGTGAAAWTPDAPTGALSAYGRSKLAGEAAVRAAGGRAAILRASWVFAAAHGNFVTTMLRLGATRPTLHVVADQIGGPVWASDLAHACRRVADTLSHRPETAGLYHYAGLPSLSRADFARAIMAEAGRDCTIEDIATADYPTPAERPLNARLDCTATWDTFGLDPPDWRIGLAQVVREERDRHDA
ncbi:dTDP-4-dehydrorhamnose reductase [Rhodobacteraceae bacterium CCMM004]|nr:dTDP-4-dehydrorhamnose reductase [Rhodobacteraceae bacterium CCMM004]